MSIKRGIHSVPYDQREAIHTAISELIEKVEGDGDGSKINRIEKALTRYIVMVHHDRATAANKKAIASIKGDPESPFTKADMKKVLAALNAGFSGMDSQVENRLKKDIAEIYKTGKIRFVRQFGTKAVRQKSVNPMNLKKMLAYLEKQDELGVGIDFGIVDEAAIANLARLTKVSIGTHFPRTLQPRVVASIQKNVFDRGLNKQQAGEALRSELTRINGGNAFAAVPASIVQQGERGVNAYYEGLSATNVTLARNFANIQAMDEAGIVQIQFVAVIDNRTSEVCLSMDGRIFEIEQAKAFRQQVFDAENVEDLKDFAAWRKDLSEFGLSAGQNLNDPAISSQLAAAGVIVPPLHFRCRSELHPA